MATMRKKEVRSRGLRLSTIILGFMLVAGLSVLLVVSSRESSRESSSTLPILSPPPVLTATSNASHLNVDDYITMNTKLITAEKVDCECGCPKSALPNCPRLYEISDVIASAKLLTEDSNLVSRDIHEYNHLELMKRKHSAQIVCMVDEKSVEKVTSTGGYCLGVGKSGGQMIIPFPDRSIQISKGHYPASRKFTDNLRSFIVTENVKSFSDFGAGQGQYGAKLQVANSESFLYRGYDGAGDVEVYTQGFVKFFDLTIPLDLPVSDWLMTLEVGEHIPSSHEGMMIRNLHAHNCKGLILSWAQTGHGGHFHVNLHDNDYLIKIFEELGYALDKEATEGLITGIPSMYGFLRNTMVLRRKDPVC